MIGAACCPAASGSHPSVRSSRVSRPRFSPSCSAARPNRRQMGHYVQQALLRHFQDPARPDFIWMYVRGEQEGRLLPIERVAQSPGYYDADVERDLSQLVEGPTTPLLDALRRGETLDETGRTAVAVYAATCIKRVPRAREQGRELIPHTLEAVVERLRTELPELSGGDPVRMDKLRN